MGHPKNQMLMREPPARDYSHRKLVRVKESFVGQIADVRLLDNAHRLRNQRVVFFGDFEDSKAKGGAPGRTPFGER